MATHDTAERRSMQKKGQALPPAKGSTRINPTITPEPEDGQDLDAL